VLLSYKLDFEVRSETARGRLLVSENFKMCPVHFLRIATSIAISREQKCPPHQSASPDATDNYNAHDNDHDNANAQANAYV
jgi:hypothetical protein